MSLLSFFTNNLEMDLFYMVLLSLLLMAGDVETNPGPYNKGTLSQYHFYVQCGVKIFTPYSTSYS